MNWWLLVGGIILLLVVLGLAGRQSEGFTTVDLQSAQAQRQQLQFEGEGRYNTFARLQSPATALDPDVVTAAIGQTLPVPTTRTPGFLSMIGFSDLGAAAPPSNATGVEQTGAVQAKINFCESLTTVDCAKLSDPRMAECGFCHRDGLSSTGKAHRGGMYISSDDQIRANEVSNATGKPAVYQPTVGSCKPADFTLMQANCEAREAQLTCQRAGAPTLANQCGQCFGGAPANATGLLVVGPKPRSHTVTLHVSHPGGHSYNGLGLRLVNVATGVTYTLPYSSKPLYDPQTLTFQVTEGDQLQLSITGMPKVWCGWFSSPDGKRMVSVDVGEQQIAPANAFMTAGDARSGPVTGAFAAAGIPVPSTPNTVMWYQRRDEVVPGMTVSAWYGLSPSTAANPQGVDVTATVKDLVGQGKSLVVLPSALGVADPFPNQTKTLWVTQDNGVQIAHDGQTMYAERFTNYMQMTITMPATLVDPLLAPDLADCPTGPLVFTEVGAGLMGSHSCFKPDGSFNPTQYCLQELFQGAGGTAQGTAFPNTDAKVAALVQNDPATGKPSLDATVAFLNNQANIAIYGVDMGGKPADFATYKATAMSMLGEAISNPCDGATAASGPHTPECLDYLWRTAGAVGSPQGDPTKLPYAYCTAAGEAAPLNADGSVNQTNVSAANAKGSVGAVRQFYASIFEATKDQSNFDNQATAIRNCYGTTLVPPPPTPDACPTPSPGDWQCVGPDDLQEPEVYHVRPNGGYTVTISQAPGVCQSLGGRLASTAEVYAAQTRGADWCSTGWVNDNASAMYPTTTTTGPGCGGPGVQVWTSSSGRAAVNCFGIKPPQGTKDVMAFNGGAWNDPAAKAIGLISPDEVPAVRMGGGNQIQFASSNGTNLSLFPSKDACKAWAVNTAANPALAARPMTIGGSTNPRGINSAVTDFKQGGTLLRVSDSGAIFFVPKGSNTAHQIPGGGTWCGVNVSNPSVSLTQAQFNAQYNVGGEFQCGMGSPVDVFLRSRA